MKKPASKKKKVASKKAVKKRETRSDKVVLDDSKLETIRILSGLQLSETQVADYMKVSRTTWARLKKEHPEIALTIARARVEMKAKAIRVVDKHLDNNDLEAAKYILDRKFGWKGPTKVEITGASGGAIQLQPIESYVERSPEKEVQDQLKRLRALSDEE